MALVNMLRFNADCGACVSDEEFWNIYFRRRKYCDNLHSLLDEESGPAWNMEVVYGGTGYPALHTEIVNETRKALKERMKLVRRHKASPPVLVKEIARIAFEEMTKAIRRRIDLKLRFFYGVDTADVNKASLSTGGESFKIASGKVLEALRSLASGAKKDALLRQIFETKAVVWGFDPEVGVTAYHLSPDKYICGYVHEGFECIGTGKYASGLSLGKDFRTRTLMMRKAGYSKAEGLYELLLSAYIARDHFKEVGGNMNIVFLDRAGRSREDRIREIFDDTARLAGEIVTAQRAGLIERAQAVSLLDDLVFQGTGFESVESALFKKAGNKEHLLFALRGYKLKEIPELLARKKRSGKTPSGGKGGRK
jgi:hypothetical protein